MGARAVANDGLADEGHGEVADGHEDWAIRVDVDPGLFAGRPGLGLQVQTQIGDCCHSISD